MKTWRLVTVFVALLTVLLNGAPSALGQGNSGAAHACQKGGHAALVGIGGETFTNAGECASFVARGGTFASGIIVPASQRVTFSNAVLSADNAITYGYSVNGSMVELGQDPPGRSTTFPADATVGPFATAVVVKVYLHDATCGATYFSDGNHAIVVASPPVYEVDIADAGSGCNRQNVPVSGFSQGNLSVRVTTHP